MARPRTPIGSYGTISTRRLDTGRWQAQARRRFPDGSNRPVRAIGPTEAKATAALREKMGRLTTGGSIAITPDTTLALLAKVYERDLAASDRAPGTKARYAEALVRIVAAIGELTIRETTPGTVTRFLRDADSGTKHARVVLAAMLDLALAEDAVAYNAVRVTKPPKPTPRKAPKSLRSGDLAAVRAAVARWEKSVTTGHKHVWVPLGDVILMQIATGTRISEVLAFIWRDVDLDAGTVVIGAKVQWVRGQGLVRSRPKNSTDADPVVVVRLPRAAVAMLRRRLAEGGIHLVGSAAPVFPSVRGTFMYPNNLQRAWRTAKSMSPVDIDWVKPHAFRKSAITAVVDDLGLEQGAKFARHKDTRVTEAHYWDKDAQALDATAPLDDLLAGW